MIKLYNYLAVIVLITFTNCSQAEGITGNGNVKKENREVSAFNAIKLNGVFNVFLKQGDELKLIIEADDNILPVIKSNVENDVLIIKTKKLSSIKKSTKTNVYITFKDINQIDFSGVGDLNCEFPIKLTKLSINNHGVGNINLTGSCNEVVIKNAGVGNINTSKLTAKKMDVSNSGVGNVDIYVTDELKLTNSGIGNIYYGGGASIIDINSHGIGRVKKK